MPVLNRYLALPADARRSAQVLGAAVRWRYMTRNPAVEAGRNPEPRSEELLPVRARTRPSTRLEARAGGRCAEPLVSLRRRDRAANRRVGAALGSPRCRPERDRAQCWWNAAHYAAGTLTPYPKTIGSRRRVPLSAAGARGARRLPPRLDTPLLFPLP